MIFLIEANNYKDILHNYYSLKCKKNDQYFIIVYFYYYNISMNQLFTFNS